MERAKTECRRGHALSDGNVRLYAGKRHCRKCAVIAAQNYRARAGAKVTPLSRFNAKHAVSDTLSWNGTPCWIWTKPNDQGYGLIGSGGRTVRAHRFAYEHFIGPIPEGLELDHLCRRPSCVNPLHVEPVTHHENMLRGKRGRNAGKWELAKTHCPHGHPYVGDNLRVVVYKNGIAKRFCRACNLRGQRERAAARRLAA